MSNNLSIFQNRKSKLDAIEYCKRYSVFAPIVNGDQLLFQVRSNTLNSQPNEICFPGGKIEPDEFEANASIRETCEELKIKQDNIQLIGELDTVITPFNTIIYPFIGYISDYNNTFNLDEVQEVFYVPLKWILENEPLHFTTNVEINPDSDFPFHMIQHGKKYPWAKGKYNVYFYEYGDKIIWGITARIVKNISDILKYK